MASVPAPDVPRPHMPRLRTDSREDLQEDASQVPTAPEAEKQDLALTTPPRQRRLPAIWNVPASQIPGLLISYVKWVAINFILPFVNGVMLGAGEITAHELAFKWGYKQGARVLPSSRMGLSGAAGSFNRKLKDNGVKVIVGEPTMEDRID